MSPSPSPSNRPEHGVERRSNGAESGKATGVKQTPKSARLIVAVIAGLANSWLVYGGSHQLARTIGAGVFMAAFVYWGLRVMDRIRPKAMDPDERDASLPPPPGGWASQTSSQKFFARIGRLRNPNRRSAQRPRR